MTQKQWGVRVMVVFVGENSENSEIYLLKLDTRETFFLPHPLFCFLGG